MMYQKECPKCHKVGLVPAMYNECLSCIEKFKKLKPWESVCLQCGKVEEHLPDGHRLCLDCIGINLGNARDKFEQTLTDKQKELLEEMDVWESVKTSYVILMS